MKIWHFFDKVYCKWVVFCVGSLEELKKFLDEGGYKYVDELKLARGCVVKLDETNNDINNRSYVVWLQQYTHADLVHELAHLVFFIFDDLGVPLSLENTEAHAFYLEHWFTEIQKVKKKYPNGSSTGYFR